MDSATMSARTRLVAWELWSQGLASLLARQQRADSDQCRPFFRSDVVALSRRGEVPQRREEFYCYRYSRM